MKKSSSLRRIFFGLIICFFALIFIKAKNPDTYFEISKNLEVFTSLFKELNESYVDNIEPGKLVKVGIDAMLNELDPYTNYITEDDMADYKFQTTGKYGGIGCTVLEKDGYIVVDHPYENSPVLKAGIKSGDIILEVNEKSTKGKSPDDMSLILKGSPGSKIQFLIKDPISGIETKKTVVREEIDVSSVPYVGMLQNNEMGYIRLTQFTQRCGNLMRSGLDSLKKVYPNMKGLIVDLRYNPGGLLDEAVNVCNLFLGSGQTVVSTKGRIKEWEKDYKTIGTAWDENMPITVLINNNSASASEIVAGTIQDLDRGVVIGTRSFGKGLVQTTRPLSFDAKLKVTTAKYYTPSGRCIQAIDYNNRNKEGATAEVPDSLKTKYKTKMGRTVWDGGGIEPDIKIAKQDEILMLSTLLEKNLIFDYATLFVSKNSTIAKPSTFSVNDVMYDDFVKWLDNKTFNYNTKTERALQEFKKIAESENYFDAAKADYAKLASTLSRDKKQDLIKFKPQLKKALQNEIVSRYYYQKGTIENLIKDDEAVLEAISVLNDKARYKKILSN